MNIFACVCGDTAKGRSYIYATVPCTLSMLDWERREKPSGTFSMFCKNMLFVLSFSTTFAEVYCFSALCADHVHVAQNIRYVQSVCEVFDDDRGSLLLCKWYALEVLYMFFWKIYNSHCGFFFVYVREWKLCWQRHMNDFFFQFILFHFLHMIFERKNYLWVFLIYISRLHIVSVLMRHGTVAITIIHSFYYHMHSHSSRLYFQFVRSAPFNKTQITYYHTVNE